MSVTVGQREVVISVCSASCDTSWTNVGATGRPFATVSCPEACGGELRLSECASEAK